ncbi:MAG TPA: hypothetical protein VJO53_07635 [Candidatus Acidoferrales bacterium]|nr:hypothetical protein [Candidatus Acidoferrales bacterium]
MTPKTPSTTLNPPARAPKPAPRESAPADLAAQWKEARLVYPIYAALATQFDLAPLPYPPGELPPARPTRSVFDGDMKWLATIDEKVRAFQIRQLSPEILNASEESLRALVHRQLAKPDKTDADRDKIDLLLVQYFVLCASDDLVHKEVTLEDVARTLQPVLAAADPTRLEWCEPLEKILEKTKNSHSLSDMMEDGLLEQGRLVKDSAGAMFYDPAALVAFCRFNFLLRRAFIRMLHADLTAVREAIDSLEAKGVKSVDCRGAGFSAAETTIQLRYFCENWRQPFQKDYTQSSVRRAFEQLLAVRAELEEALGNKPSNAKPAPAHAPSDKSTAPAPEPEEENLALMGTSTVVAHDIAPPVRAVRHQEEPAPDDSQASHAGAGAPPSHPAAKPAAEVPAAPTAAAEAEKCLEAIWEQLIAVPPSRGRSMSTVVLQDTKVLLSSWEVAAFVTEGGQESEDLRRAVVARALLALASDKKKRSGEETALASALVLARSEVSYFQGRVEQAKRAKNTEAAVNLGISTKRLLSFMEEAEKL